MTSQEYRKYTLGKQQVLHSDFSNRVPRPHSVVYDIIGMHKIHIGVTTGTLQYCMYLSKLRGGMKRAATAAIFGV